MGAETWREVFVAELGQPPEARFEHFEAEPIASASIGQVHRAVLDGQSVCVKVQYPGIAEATESDLRNVGGLIRVLRAIMPNVDTRKVFGDIRSRLLEECDYRQEAAYQRDFAARYREDPDIVVPEVIDALSTRRVLTTRLVTGLRLGELVARGSQRERDRAGAALFRFAFEGILHHGLVHADPHPGNFLFRADGTARTGVLDFGFVQPLGDQARVDLGALLRAALAGHDLVGPIERAFGIAEMDPETRRFLAEIAPRMLAPLLEPQPYRFTRAHAAAVVRAVVEAKKRLATRFLVRWGRFKLEREGVAPVFRCLVGLSNVWATLEPVGDFRALTERLLGRPPARAAGP
jgi:predicted unusual protein kinase regulating ubiquinone biosynthesis (AarF/ABC1/UbiB family)